MITNKSVGVYCKKDNLKKLEKYLDEQGFQVDKGTDRLSYEIQLGNYVFHITVLEASRMPISNTAKLVAGYDDIKSFCRSLMNGEERPQRGGVAVANVQPVDPEIPENPNHGEGRYFAYHHDRGGHNDAVAREAAVVEANDQNNEEPHQFTDEEIANGEDALPF